MADKDTNAHQRNEAEKEDETQDKQSNSQEETEENENEIQKSSKDSTSLALSTDTEKNASSGDTTTQSDCESVRPTEGPCFNPEDQSVSKVPEGNPVSMDKDRSDGHNTETQQDGPPINMQCGDYSKGPSGSEETQVILNEKSEDMPTKSTMEEATKTPVEAVYLLNNEGTLEPAPEKPVAQTPLPQEMPTEEQTLPEKDIETIGPTSQVEGSPPTPEVPLSVKEDKRKYWIAVALVVVVAIVFQLIQPESPPQKKDVRQIDIFHQEMEKLKVQFPSQREELWKRSKIHLQRHFQISHPTEPISLILTAGVRAEGTLRSLAWSIASALSSALNASVLHIEGASKASQNSDEVKSDIDSQLQKAFEGDKPIAVIHHFEDLPPASTLIFYRYCDHENAAFKKTFLIFTILLGDEEEIPAMIRLNAVEEMVNDHLQKKFLSHGHPTAFDKMDIDKYSGLWSRISHLILPVATEERI